MEGWVVQLSSVANNGDITQLYPAWAAAGADPSTATLGDQIRQPIEGQIISLQVRTDGTNGGYVELWDANGALGGADVSSDDEISDAEMAAMISAGNAKLIYTQNFVALPETPINMGWKGFLKGLAARFVGTGGVCYLNIVVNGGYRYITKL